MNFSKVINPVTKFGAKALFKLKNAAPEILIGVGVVGVIGTVILACKETPKALDIIEEHKDMMDRINEVHNDSYLKEVGLSAYPEEYTDNQYRRDVFVQYSHTAWKLIRNYAPATTLLSLSLTAILYSHGLMSKRNARILAAYKALEESYETYRKRIKERYGEQADFSAGFVNEIVDEERTQEDGTVVSKKVAKVSESASPYARFFDEFNPNWEKDRSLNLFFLKAQEKFANDKLHSQGFLFLNDVYEALGFQKTSAGQLVGWYLGGDGDDYVDFGIFEGDNEKKRDFVNGLEPAVLIDPNVDGVIYDLI